MKRPIKRAVISVYDKSGLIEFATELHAQGVEIVSTGSTAATISNAGIPVIKVEELTGFPESLDGRVKTLHPKIHGGILSKRNLKSHQKDLLKNNFHEIDLVVVNFYPFEKTLTSTNKHSKIIENIDSEKQKSQLSEEKSKSKKKILR